MTILNNKAPATSAYISICEARTAFEVSELLQDIPLNSTIFLDVDETIIAPISSSFRIAPDKDLVAGIKIHQNCPDRDNILSAWRLERKVMLVDKNWANVIDDLKVRYEVYGLTKMGSGRLGQMESLEKWREEELRRLGVVFTQKAAAQELKVDAGYEMNPLFYGGILFTGGASKGETIMLFDSILSVKFVVLVDDVQGHLENVADFCRKKRLGFLGIHFKGAENLPGIYTQELAEFQTQYLIKHGKWLEDEEAIKLLRLR